MAHALAGRCGHAGDVGHHRLADKSPDVFSGSFFVTATNLAHHDNAFGLRVTLKQLDDINEIHATHRIAANAHAGALTQAIVGGLKHGFVSQRARARDDADGTSFVDEAGHDAQLALTGCNDAGAIRANEPGAGTRQRRLDTNHVIHRDALGDAHHEFDAGFRGFKDAVGRIRCRHVDHAGRGTGGAHRIAHGIEHGQAQMLFTTAPGCHAAHEPGAVSLALLGVKTTLFAGESLANDPGAFIDENAHGV